MRKYTLGLLFTLSMLPLLDLLGQTWQDQHPKPYQEELNDFFFIDTHKGWICGEDGLILVSADRGINWAKQNNRNNQDLNSICFIDEKRGWAVGDSTTVLFTDNGGNTWQELPFAGPLVSFQKIQFLDSQRGWIMSSQFEIFRTIDGGSSWQSSTLGALYNLIDMQFVDNQNGWALTNSSIWLTTNGGITWSEQIPTVGISLNAFHFSDVNHGWIVGEQGHLLKTTNGGITWADSTIALAASYSLLDVHFFDSLNGVTMRPNFVLQTNDGGQSWSFLTGGTYNKFFFIDILNGWAFGFDNNSFYTKFNGQNFINRFTINRGEVLEVHAINDQEIWAVGEVGELFSPDGGESWFQQGAISTPCTEVEFDDTGQNGWLITSWLKVLRTTNGGLSWTPSPSLGVNFMTNKLKGLTFVDSQNGWVGSDYGAIYKTTDGGLNWQTASSFSNNVNMLKFKDAQFGWGCNVLTFITTNGGASWGLDPLFNNKTVTEMDFLDSLNGWAIGEDIFTFESFVMKTTDGGLSWTTTMFGTALGLKSVSFRDNLHGWIVDDSGIIRYSSNGGQNWVVQDSSKHEINSISASKGLGCWAAGQQGTILNYSNCSFPTPVIVNNSNVLDAGVHDTYLWYLNGSFILFAFNQTFTATTAGVYTVVVTNGINCEKTSFAYVLDSSTLLPIQLTEPTSSEKSSFKVYPNPSRGLFTVDFENKQLPQKLLVINSLGQLIKVYESSSIHSEMNLDLTFLPNGIYWLATNDSEVREAYKVFIFK